jgi:hypothetical protein
MESFPGPGGIFNDLTWVLFIRSRPIEGIEIGPLTILEANKPSRKIKGSGLSDFPHAPWIWKWSKVVGKKREGLLRFGLKNKKANILFHESQTGSQKFPSATLISGWLGPASGSSGRDWASFLVPAPKTNPDS